MTGDRTATEFDEYSDNYSESLAKGLSVSGESQEFFAKGRIEWLARRLEQLRFQSRTVLDYGCGQGSSTPVLRACLDADSAVGVDVSAGLLDVAARNNPDPKVSYRPVGEGMEANHYDCAYMNGVLHHIPLDNRADVLRQIFHALKPGGFFGLWENNPWNPGTRYVMNRIPFDRDAVTLSIPEARQLARNCGFSVDLTDSIFFFPRSLSALRRLEPALSHTWLGAQYMVLCRKPR